MTIEQLGDLFDILANYYWSVPVSFAMDKIIEWHPEVTPQQIKRAIKRCKDDMPWHHCYIQTDGLEESELVAEHLLAVDETDMDRFLAARIDGPYNDCQEETLFLWKEGSIDIPEHKAIKDFGRTEMGLDDEWALQLADDCLLSQVDALCEGGSWVMAVLKQESYGKIYFHTLEQVRRFRELGNALYHALPNPVLKGWRPMDLASPPVLPDDIPERDEDIPNDRPELEAQFAPYGGLDKFREQFMQKLISGRNDPCPCGSGKKYKKCCGRKA